MDNEIKSIFDDANDTPTNTNTDNTEEIKSIFDDTQKLDETIEVLQLDEEEKLEDTEVLDDVNETINEEPKKEEKNNVLKDKVIKHSKILPIIAFLFVLSLGIYIILENVNSDKTNLIKIEDNGKVGYINNKGKVIIKPKFLSGSDFYKGYAIVKNYNNLYGIVNSKGKTKIPFGNIISAEIYSGRYVVSKITSNGLKNGLLDSNLKEITRFKYDNLAYSKLGLFIFTYDDTMGIMNKDGKEIYSYKVDEVDNKNISIEVSNVNNKKYPSYAVIKVNESSTIINTTSGKEVYKYTLDDIYVLDNNVFYINKTDGNNKYLIVKNDKVVFETEDYKVVKVEDVGSNILIGIKEDTNIDYINILDKQIMNKEGSVKYTYSEGVLLQELYDFNKNKIVYTVLTPEKNLSTFEDKEPVTGEFINGYMKIKLQNGKYSFINKNGNVIKGEYDDVYDFNKNGYAIVSKDRKYGVLDTTGKLIIDTKYDDIKLLDDELFKNILKKTNKKLFIAKQDNKYGIIDSNQKVVLDFNYDEFEIITKKYPIISADNNLINLYNYKKIKVKINSDTSIYEDYIKNGNLYYNYDGNIIYPLGG